LFTSHISYAIQSRRQEHKELAEEKAAENAAEEGCFAASKRDVSHMGSLSGIDATAEVHGKPEHEQVQYNVMGTKYSFSMVCGSLILIRSNMQCQQWL
jgi:hypothetical protein